MDLTTPIKIAGRNINNLRYADDTTLMAESEELKSLLMKVKEESEKVGLKPLLIVFLILEPFFFLLKKSPPEGFSILVWNLIIFFVQK